MINNPRLGRFYMLPKIHKRLLKCQVDLWFRIRNIILNIFHRFLIITQPLAQKVKSYVKDTNDFLCKLRELKKVPENAILCTIDVVGLYPSIPHEEDLAVLKKVLDGESHGLGIPCLEE